MSVHNKLVELVQKRKEYIKEIQKKKIETDCSLKLKEEEEKKNDKHNLINNFLNSQKIIKEIQIKKNIPINTAINSLNEELNKIKKIKEVEIWKNVPILYKKEADNILSKKNYYIQKIQENRCNEKENLIKSKFNMKNSSQKKNDLFIIEKSNTFSMNFSEKKKNILNENLMKNTELKNIEKISVNKKKLFSNNMYNEKEKYDNGITKKKEINENEKDNRVFKTNYNPNGHTYYDIDENNYEMKNDYNYVNHNINYNTIKNKNYEIKKKENMNNGSINFFDYYDDKDSNSLFVVNKIHLNECVDEKEKSKVPSKSLLEKKENKKKNNNNFVSNFKRQTFSSLIKNVNSEKILENDNIWFENYVKRSLSHTKSNHKSNKNKEYNIIKSYSNVNSFSSKMNKLNSLRIKKVKEKMKKVKKQEYEDAYDDYYDSYDDYYENEDDNNYKIDGMNKKNKKGTNNKIEVFDRLWNNAIRKQNDEKEKKKKK